MIQVLSLVEHLFPLKNPLQDLLFSLNALISTNESTEFITGHVIYNLYTYKFQLKTNILILQLLIFQLWIHFTIMMNCWQPPLKKPSTSLI